MESKGYLLGNIDVTVIAERPKISPHKQQILDNLYSLLKTPADTINLKVRLHILLSKPTEYLALTIKASSLFSEGMSITTLCRRRHQRE